MDARKLLPNNFWFLPALAAIAACQPVENASTPATAPSSAASASPTASASATPEIQAGSLSLETIDQLVGVTDPVYPFSATETHANAVEAASFNSLQLPGLRLSTATAGVSLGDSTSDIDAAFDAASNGSKAYCETVNTAMKFFIGVSDPDSQLCVLRAMAKKSKGFAAGTTKVWDAIVSNGGMSMTMRFKFKVEGDDEKLSSFESFTCSGRGTNLTQQGYTKQTFADGKVSVISRSKSAMHENFQGKITMEAALNSAGKMVGLKKIEYADETDGRSVHGKATQSDENIRYIGYESSQGRLTQYYSFAELLDANIDGELYAPTKLAYGDGAALVRISESHSSSAETYIEGWDGATLSKNASEPRVSKVEDMAGSLMAKDTGSLDLDFPTAAQYDCTGTADETFTSAQIFSEASYDCSAAFEIDQDGRDMCQDLSY